MKTQIQTNLPGIENAVLHLKPINPGETTIRYTVTGHNIQTVEMTAADVMRRFGHHFDEDGNGNLTIVAKDNAHIELSADVRHGVKGFRANRYELVNEINQIRQWDGWPIFFETIDQALQLFALPTDSGAYEKQKREARLRF